MNMNMKKNFLTFVFFVIMPLFCTGQDNECGWDGEADRSNGAGPCISMCIQGYESCEAVYNRRYQQKLEDLFYSSLDELCRQWASRIFRIPIPGGADNDVCDIWTLTADIDSEHWTNLQIAINYLNRCVNTCDSH